MRLTDRAHSTIPLLTFLIALAISGTRISAQGKAAVEVKDDGEFTGKRKVELAEQRISPTLTISITAEIDTRTKADRFRDLGVSVIRFVSTTDKREYGGGGIEFNFLVDGERVTGGTAKSSPLNDNRVKDGKEVAIGAISSGALVDIGRGRDVKMKIGDQVITLDQTVIKNIAEFVRALVR